MCRSLKAREELEKTGLVYAGLKKEKVLVLIYTPDGFWFHNNWLKEGIVGSSITQQDVKRGRLSS